MGDKTHYRKVQSLNEFCDSELVTIGDCSGCGGEIITHHRQPVFCPQCGERIEWEE